MHSRHFVSLVLAGTLAFAAPAGAQVQRIFSDSPDSTEWSDSWGFASGGSALDLRNSTHVPVTTNAFLGRNAVRLTWLAAAAGTWELTVATRYWVAFDSTPYDSVVFAVWSPQALGAGDLPLFFLEDADNHRTPSHPLSDFVAGVPATTWTRVAVPLSAYRADPGPADLTRLNKVFFSQAATMTPNVVRTLVVDEIRCSAAGLAAPPVPEATTRAFERHVELRWDPATLAGAEALRIERLVGSDWQAAGDASAADGSAPVWLGDVGVDASLRARAVGPDLRASAASPPLTARTRAMSDPEWLDMAQEAAFRYFWFHAHPASGLARERYGAASTCATGGTGMGIQAIVVGASRGWVPRADAAARVLAIASFYEQVARSFHGAYSHWVDGGTGAVIPADAPDDSSMDVVETSYLMQGLLVARQYFDGPDPAEAAVRETATRLWERMDWNAFRPAYPGNALYWLWSPQYGFAHSFQLGGWNEAMIGYLLAIASPTHPIPAFCYAQGWARFGAMVNGRLFYGIPLYVGPDWGGGLYLNQYTFMTLDPRFKRDAYANYEKQCRNASDIDRLYCAANPGGHAGYSGEVWGITASDDPWGYSARGPYSNDNGTLAPTAALGMMPFTYAHSLAALKAMYRTYGDRLWGPFGFTDAFNPGADWFASSYIAIDEGPIVVMLENARTQLVWDLFMRNPEIAPALTMMGFVADSAAVSGVEPGAPAHLVLAAAPNPSRGAVTLSYALPVAGAVEVTVHDVAGRTVATLLSGRAEAGPHEARWDGRDADGRRAPPGVYLCRVRAGGEAVTRRIARVE